MKRPKITRQGQTWPLGSARTKRAVTGNPVSRSRSHAVWPATSVRPAKRAASHDDSNDLSQDNNHEGPDVKRIKHTVLPISPPNTPAKNTERKADDHHPIAHYSDPNRVSDLPPLSPPATPESNAKTGYHLTNHSSVSQSTGSPFQSSEKSLLSRQISAAALDLGFEHDGSK
jgi:hypothetical protein